MKDTIKVKPKIVFNQNEIFISTKEPQGNFKILFQGTPKYCPTKIIDQILVTGDSSYNPSRPFRWYRHATEFNTMAFTDVKDTEEGSVMLTRKKCYDSFLEALGNPEFAIIYEQL